MRKYSVLFLLAALLSGCGKPRRQLNIFTWPEDLDPKLVAEFEKQFDCKVAIDFYATSEMMMAKLSAGGDSVYDVVAPASGNLASLIKRGLLAPLRPDNIPNVKNVDPTFAEPSADSRMQFSIPYQWGTGGLGHFWLRRTNA